MTEKTVETPERIVAAEPAATEPASPPGSPPTAPKPPAQRRGTPYWLTFVLFLALATGLGYVVRHPAPQDTTRITSLETELKAAQQRIAQLEQKPLPDMSLLVAPVTGRVAVVEAALRGLADRPAPSSLDIAGALAPIGARLDALEKASAQDVAVPIAAASQALGARIDALDAKFTASLSKVTASATNATRLSAVLQALDNGQKLGDIPGAPPPLAKFAQTAPPTEAALRQRFPAAAAAAQSASQPSPAGRDFLGRMWDRAQGLVTVSRGGHVLLGAPAAVTLADARTKLDAGDLAGTIAALAALDPPAAAAMAGWKGDAQALLDARAALAAMAKS